MDHIGANLIDGAFGARGGTSTHTHLLEGPVMYEPLNCLFLAVLHYIIQSQIFVGAKLYLFHSTTSKIVKQNSSEGQTKLAEEFMNHLLKYNFSKNMEVY